MGVGGDRGKATEDASPTKASATGKEASVRKGKRRTKRSSKEEHVSYLVRVADWNYYYSFAVSDPKSRWDPGPYNELTTVDFSGEIIRPEKCRYKRATVALSGRAGMLEETRAPISIGSLTANEDELSAYVFVPAQRAADLATAGASGRVQIVQFTATKLRYRSAQIINASVNTRFDEEQW